MKSEPTTVDQSNSESSHQKEQSPDHFIQACGLCYQSSDKKIVDNLSFQLNLGERIALVGLNGAGKSSLLKLLVGELVATSGEIRIAGLSPFDLASKERLGYQASDMLALPAISVKEYLELALSLKKKTQSQCKQLIDEVIEQWSLHSIVDKNLIALSQGNMQKVAIAQAFLYKPDFLFLDEPTQALDPLEQERFIKNLTSLESSQSCIFSSHHISEAVASSDKVMMLHQGRLIATLDLNSSSELWFIVSNENLNNLSQNELVETVYQGDCNSLVLIRSEDGEIGNKSPLTSGFRKLGDSKEAIMPLFSLLANQEL